MSNQKLIVMDRCASMPTSCWGQYRHLAVVLVDTDVLEQQQAIADEFWDYYAPDGSGK